MPKEDLKPALNANAPAVAPAPAAAPATVADEPPRLGSQIRVKVAKGLQLINMETGLEFVPDVATEQTVTITTLKRLADGDLVRV